MFADASVWWQSAGVSNSQRPLSEGGTSHSLPSPLSSDVSDQMMYIQGTPASWKYIPILITYKLILMTRRIYMSRLITKPTKWQVHPAKTQISLGICPVWSVFAVRMKKAWVVSYPLSGQRRLWSDWAHSYFAGFVMSRLIFSQVPAIAWLWWLGYSTASFVVHLCFCAYIKCNKNSAVVDVSPA